MGALVASAGCVSMPKGRAPVAGDLGDLLEEARSRHGLPALAAAVANSEQVLSSGAAGYRKDGDLTPVGLDDQWHLGSDTKAMTATLVGMFVESGQLRWDSTLAELLPDWAPGMSPAYRAVTLRMLLTHRSGMPDFSLITMLGLFGDSRDPAIARAEAVKELLSREPEHPPGTTFLYSNAGYVTVGVVLNRVSGKPWEALIRERLFEPLHMTSCGLGSPGVAGKVEQPWGHRPPNLARRILGGGPVPYEPGPFSDNPAAFGPAGTVHCSLADWAKFLAIHLKGARGEPTALLSVDTIKTLQTPWPGGDYAMGWGVADRPWARGRVLAHEGSNTFFLATVVIAPQQDRIYMVTTNVFSEDAQDAEGELVKALAAKQ